MASGEVAATHVGGCGCWNGLGSTSTSSKSQYLPWNVNRSFVHAASTTSTASRKRGAVSSIGTPKLANSESSNPRPAPQLMRPPVSTSISATSSARRNGWYSAASDTAVPIRRFVVRWAASNAIRWTDGHTLYVVKWCSASHTAS